MPRPTARRSASRRAMGYVADVFDSDDAGRAARARWRSATCATRPPARAGSSNAQPILIDCAHGQIAHLPQRQPGQRRRAARRARPAGLDLPVEQRHRGRAAPLRAVEGRRASRTPIVESVSQVQGAFSFVMMTQGSADRRARSARVPAARARPARRRVGRLLGDVRDGSDRRDLRARRRAGRGARDQRRRAAVDQAVRRRRRWRTACSSTSTSRGPTATCSARASTKCAPTSAASWRASSAVDADVVVPVPDSGVCAAMGYAEEAGHPAAHGPHPQSLRRPHVHPAAVSRSGTSA